MSRWAHGKSANSLRKAPAVRAPPPRPPEFFMSAVSPLICSVYSSKRGSGHALSPAASPARGVPGRSTGATAVGWGVMAPTRLHGPEDRRAAAHVELHVLHTGTRLYGDAPGVERYGLPYEHDGRVPTPFTVLQHDEAGLVGGRPADGRETG